MANERKYLGIPPLPFIIDGGSTGLVRILSTASYKVKQKVRVFTYTTQTQKIQLEVKLVLNSTDLYLGPVSSNMDERSNLSAFTVAAGAQIEAIEQSRPDIPQSLRDRAVFEEEPTVALRTVLVDTFGDKYSSLNPLPVDASVSVSLTHKDNDPNPGDKASSVRIGDGTNEAKVNADGSLNVVVLSEGSSDQIISVFNEISSVAIGSEEIIVTYTVPSGSTFYLNKVDYSGDNIAKYSLLVNGSVIDLQRTYFGSSLNGSFNFINGSRGLELTAGDVIELKVIHNRPFVGDFNGRMQIVESA